MAGLGRSLGQFAAQCSTKTQRHFTHPSLSLRSLRSESKSLGHCLCGGGAVLPENVDLPPSLLGIQHEEGSLDCCGHWEFWFSLVIFLYSSFSARRPLLYHFTWFGHLRNSGTLLTFSVETFFESLVSMPAPSWCLNLSSGRCETVPWSKEFLDCSAIT